MLAYRTLLADARFRRFWLALLLVMVAGGVPARGCRHHGPAPGRRLAASRDASPAG
ncbi:MAG: hypothetical protein NT133_02695 [Alphaproteobacteria bacterium]|nr:hypothetical protein [Alphaproteobacteria bacterium]